MADPQQDPAAEQAAPVQEEVAAKVAAVKATIPTGVTLSQALPQEEDRYDLTEGVSLAITGIVIEARKSGDRGWDTAKINGVDLQTGQFIKYKSSGTVVVKKCKDLLLAICFADGSAKKPVFVKVTGHDGQNGRYLDLEDA